jgi:outer membrane protein TolC
VQVAALTALNQELAARAEVAEAQAVSLASRLERMRATTSIDAALQAFRRHLGGVPAEVDTSQFYEREEDVIGKGGCGKVG